MKCKIHQEKAANTSCVDCGQAMCEECAVTWRGEDRCPACFQDRLTFERLKGLTQPAIAQSAPQLPQPQPAVHRSKALTFFLSFIPGVGHWYLGLEVRGLWFIASFFGLIAVAAVLNAGLLALVMGPLWLYAIADSMWAFDDLATGAGPDDRPAALFRESLRVGLRRTYVGWGLVVVGLLSVINNLPEGMLPSNFEYWLRHNLIGLLLTGTGLYILAKYRHKVSEGEVGPNGGLQVDEASGGSGAESSKAVTGR